MKLYDKDGWLDAGHIEEIADRNDISFIVIIGKRQIGKTYGVLKLMLDEDKRFILLRGMKTELEMLERGVNSPFEKIAGYENKTEFIKDSEYTASIYKLTESENEESEKVTKREFIAMGAALSSIGRIRGFNGDIFSDIVYDEFIPESHLLKVRNGGDAFLNMYTTVSGNRELEGKKPLRVWLLANSNTLDNEILTALNITDDVERMTIRLEESRILKDRGIMIILPDSPQITEKRKKSALYKAIGGNSSFAKMAYDNEFSYNDFSDVAHKPLREYLPYIKVGSLLIHLHKNDKTLYITSLYGGANHARYSYNSSEHDMNMFIKNHGELRAVYMRGKMTFESMAVKNEFLHYLDI